MEETYPIEFDEISENLKNILPIYDDRIKPHETTSIFMIECIKYLSEKGYTEKEILFWSQQAINSAFYILKNDES